MLINNLNIKLNHPYYRFVVSVDHKDSGSKILLIIN